MSVEELKQSVDSAVSAAVAGDADLDEVEAVLDDAKDRLQAVRAFRGDGS